MTTVVIILAVGERYGREGAIKNIFVLGANDTGRRTETSAAK